MNITIRDAIDFFLKPVWWLDIPQYWAYSTDAGHCSADFSCDPFNIDGYRYNPANGKWYSTPPNPVMGDWIWHDPAPPEKQSIYTDMRNSVINYRKTISPPVDSIKGKLNAARSASSPSSSTSTAMASKPLP